MFRRVFLVLAFVFFGVLPVLAECVPYTYTVGGLVSGYFELSCDVCSSDGVFFTFDCDVVYSNFSNEPGLAINGRARLNADYDYSDDYLTMNFDGGPVVVSYAGYSYNINFDNLYFEFDESGIVYYSGGIWIDDYYYPASDVLFGIFF